MQLRQSVGHSGGYVKRSLFQIKKEKEIKIKMKQEEETINRRVRKKKMYTYLLDQSFNIQVYTKLKNKMNKKRS